MPTALHIGSTREVIEAFEADAADLFNGSPTAMVEFLLTVNAARAMI